MESTAYMRITYAFINQLMVCRFHLMFAIKFAFLNFIASRSLSRFDSYVIQFLSQLIRVPSFFHSFYFKTWIPSHNYDFINAFYIRQREWETMDWYAHFYQFEGHSLHIQFVRLSLDFTSVFCFRLFDFDLGLKYEKCFWTDIFD